jgi:GH15 family glucan-1,4-alpha-glucosidase
VASNDSALVVSREARRREDLAFDRAIKAVEDFGLEGPADRWRKIRAQIHAEVCARGYDAARGSFVQYYGSQELDASLLLLAQVGFLPADDFRLRGTIEAIERELVVDGLVARYRTLPGADGLPGGEGFFLPCSFWLADCLILLGRRAEAEALFERLVSLRNDVGIMSEEYDLRNGRALGNVPQALTHVALVNTARNLAHGDGPMKHRSARPTRAAPQAASARQNADTDALTPDMPAPSTPDAVRR